MKKNLYVLGTLCLTLFLASCGGAESDEPKDAEEKCFYALDTDSYELTWTAYKTTDKVAVGGTFNDVKISAGDAESMSDAINGVEFEINTGSVETQNEERNGKIAEHFFGTINTPTITGSVTAVDIENKTATVAISMNGMEFPVEGTLEVDGESFSFNATIEMDSWNAMSGITALNTVCEDLHTGGDGVSKLWSEVAIGFSGTLNKNCE